jgi:hypothetical protein
VRVVVDLAIEMEQVFLPSGAGKQFTPAALVAEISRITATA